MSKKIAKSKNKKRTEDVLETQEAIEETELDEEIVDEEVIDEGVVEGDVNNEPDDTDADTSDGSDEGDEGDVVADIISNVDVQSNELRVYVLVTTERHLHGNRYIRKLVEGEKTVLPRSAAEHLHKIGRVKIL